MAVKTRDDLNTQLSTGGSRSEVERNLIKDLVDSVELEAEAASRVAEKLTSIDSDADEAHDITSTFSDVEVEAALNALAVKLNALIDALKA